MVYCWLCEFPGYSIHGLVGAFVGVEFVGFILVLGCWFDFRVWVVGFGWCGC